LAELAQFVTGQPLDRSQESQEFATRVVLYLNAEAERLSAKHKVRFILAESRDLTAPHRLARLDQTFAGGAGPSHGSGEGYGEVFYTNSVKLPVTSRINASERIRIEGALQCGVIRNAATDLWLGASIPAADRLAGMISDAFLNTRAPAINLSPEFTICDVCHIPLRGLLSSCTQCGSARVDGLAQATNRFSRTSSWPRWKLAELRERRREEF
jgi:anaerobic ribonucleoside-triphosphate reductase